MLYCNNNKKSHKEINLSKSFVNLLFNSPKQLTTLSAFSICLLKMTNNNSDLFFYKN